MISGRKQEIKVRGMLRVFLQTFTLREAVHFLLVTKLKKIAQLRKNLAYLLDLAYLQKLGKPN